MADFTPRILLVTPDAALTDELVPALTDRFGAAVTCVNGALGALDADLGEPHDLIISEMDLGDFSGVQLAEQLGSLGERPLILLADDPLREDVLAALRLGARDVMDRPFAVDQLLDAVETALRDVRRRKLLATRYRGLRDLVRRVIRERRDLNQRMDLVCRDLVSAQRRLVQRVMAFEQQQSERA